MIKILLICYKLQAVAYYVENKRESPNEEELNKTR